jgi:tetratricopeptide (TPR) repeat protein
MEERGDTPFVWLARADVLLARDEIRAEYCFEKALLLAPRDWFIPWLGARIRRYYKQFVLALKLLQQALELNPGNFLLWLEQGHCQQAIGLVSAAEISFTQALHLNPRSQEAENAVMGMSEVGLVARLRDKLRELFHR